MARSRLIGQIKKLLAEHLDPTAYAVPEALFFTPLRSVQRALLCTLEVPPLGFGYPFDGFKLSESLEVFFSFQRSWASPYEAFFQPAIKPLFPGLFPFWHFLNKPSGLLPVLQRLTPARLAVPLFASEGLVRIEAMAPLGFLVSWALPLPKMLSSAYLESSPYIL